MPHTLFSCHSCLSTSASNGGAQQHDSPALRLDQTFANIFRSLAESLPHQVIDGSTPLDAWRPNGDLGSVLLESWAYVGDVLGFYNSSIGWEAYLSIARHQRSLRRIAAILGYQPRPAVGARAEIAAIVSGTVKPTQAALRASPVDSSAQLFESSAGSQASPGFNEYRVSPFVPDDASSGDQRTYLIESSTAAAVRGRPVAFIWFDKVIKAHATEILDVASARQSDGQDYISMKVADPTDFDGGKVKRDAVAIQSPSQRAYACTALFDLKGNNPIETIDPIPNGLASEVSDAISLFHGGYHGTSAKEVDILAFQDKTQSTVLLDGVYRAIKAGDLIILQAGAKFAVHRVMATYEEGVPLAGFEEEDAPKLPLTMLTLNPEVKSDFVLLADPKDLVIHYNLHDIGRMTRVAHTELTHALIVDRPLELEGVHDEPTNSPKRWILEDANGRGVLVDADLAVKQNGAATLTVRGPKWEGGLRVPVKAYGNVLDITRGETVQDEVLGDGDPSQPYQTFKLAKSPLTYLRAPNTERGIASTLEVRVGGILWHERASFYGAGPNDAVYIVRHDDDQNTYITFGDGVRGMRLPSGRGNVRASYRHGAGAAAPPPGAINQIARGVPGLLRVRSPIPAYGGADAETTREIRKHAPASALVLGRCVSLADFAARVARMPGIRNCKVEYSWVGEAQTAGVKVWYVPNDRDDPQPQLAAQIVADLQAMSEPGTMIRADAAIPVLNAFFINIEIEREREPGDVEAAVRAALLDPEKGLLALENTPIGGPLPRSALVAAVRAVPGVLDVTALYCYGMSLVGPFPAPGLTLAEGQYFDFDGDYAELIVVSAAHAESRGCHDLIA